MGKLSLQSRFDASLLSFGRFDNVLMQSWAGVQEGTGYDASAPLRRQAATPVATGLLHVVAGVATKRVPAARPPRRPDPVDEETWGEYLRRLLPSWGRGGGDDD